MTLVGVQGRVTTALLPPPPPSSVRGDLPARDRGLVLTRARARRKLRRICSTSYVNKR